MYGKTVLDNGMRVISEEINHVRSVSIGVWIQSGSRYEESITNGTAHFIEHMLFKGTESRSAFDIASAIDSFGGVMNAFTSKELTSFYIKIPDYHLPLAIDLLSDIFSNSRFDEEEIRKEQSVVLQEIKMLEDTPDDYIHDFFEGAFWNGHSLGLPVLGDKERVSFLDREALLSFFNARYKPNNFVLAAAGNLTHEVLAELVNRYFGSFSGGAAAVDNGVPAVFSKASFLEKDLEQIHMMIGTLAPSAKDSRRHAAFILNAILGGSMSSRLFQEIRERRGLTYAINSFLTLYMDTGLLGIYAGAGKDKVQIVLNLILEELQKLRSDMLTEKEIRGAKELIKGNFLLGMESTDNRMTRLARNEIFWERYIPPEDVIERVEKVTAEDVKRLAGEIFVPDIVSLAAIGKASGDDLCLHW